MKKAHVRRRRLHARLAALVGLVTVMVAASGSAVPCATATRFELARSPGGDPISQIDLEPSKGGADARLSFFLRQSGTTPLTGATLGWSSSELDLKVTAVGGAEEFTIPPTGQAVQLMVSASGLADDVDETLDLYLQADGGVQRNVGVLHVTRADQPHLAVVGATDAGLTFAQDRTAFTRELTVRSDTGADVKATLATTSPWHDDSSRQVPLVLKAGEQELKAGDTFEVPARSATTLTVSGALSRVSTYRASLILSYGNSRELTLVLPLTVNRTATVQTVKAEPLDPVRVQRCWPFLGCDFDAKSSIVFRETASENAAFEKVEVLVVRVEDGDTMVQADGASATASPSALPTIGPQDSQTVEAELSQVPGPGKYEVVVRGTTAGAEPVTVTATFLVRYPWYYALVLILVGAALSYILSLWLGRARGLLVAQVALDDIEARLKSIRDAGQVPESHLYVVDDVAALRQRVATRLEHDRGADLTSDVKDLDVRMSLLDEWLPLCLRVQNAAPGHPARLQLGKAEETLVQAGQLDAPAQSVVVTALGEARRLLDATPALRRREELGKILAQTAAPLGFEQAEWAALVAGVRARLDAAGPATSSAALATSDSALAELVIALAGALGPRISSKAAAARSRELNDLAARLDGVAVLAGQAAQQAADPERLTDALQTYGRTVEAYQAVAPDLATAQMMGDAASQAPVVEVSTEDGEVVAAVTVQPQQQPGWPFRLWGWAWGWLTRHGRVLTLRGVDTAVFMVIAVITALLGVLALYQGNSTWGSLVDVITAVLWGLGFGQGGAAASAGVQSVYDKYRARPSA